MLLKEYKNIYCIGIGGIGLSALARCMKFSGARVSGSDGSASKITDDLEKEGIVVHIGHDAANIPSDCDLIIYTIAIPDTNPELVETGTRGIRRMTYPEALGELTESYTTIAVCGTHGKTTTTAMIASMVTASGKKPTVIVGSILAEGGTNFLQGDSEYLIVEACEYRRSFLNLHPTHVVVTNIDEDHLDYYKDMADIHSAFQSFADKIPKDGYLVTHSNVSLDTLGTKIDADCIDAQESNLSVLGEHNKRNAQLALSLAQALGLDEEKAREGLKAFTGTWRRLEYKGMTEFGVKVYDDYGHHPVEISATLQALREAYPQGKNMLHVFFQPHLYSRTKLLLDDFALAFSLADVVYVTPIYASREKDDGTISHHDLAEKLRAHGVVVHALETIHDMKGCIEGITDPNAVVLNSGAGDAYTVLDTMILTK